MIGNRQCVGGILLPLLETAGVRLQKHQSGNDIGAIERARKVQAAAARYGHLIRQERESSGRDIHCYRNWRIAGGWRQNIASGARIAITVPTRSGHGNQRKPLRDRLCNGHCANGRRSRYTVRDYDGIGGTLLTLFKRADVALRDLQYRKYDGCNVVRRSARGSSA